MASLVAKRLSLYLKGVVQGVGFRPTLYQKVKQFGFSGSLQNRGDGVLLILEGEEKKLAEFSQNLENFIPARARIFQKQEKWELAKNLNDFIILESELGEQKELSIPVDLATCEACFQEFFDPKNRRFLYPFNACTNCGPRYTVVEDMPYDRETTTLKSFPLCTSCLQEYRNIEDRRFHAESMACPRCGPQIQLKTSSEKPILFQDYKGLATLLTQLIQEKNILAVRGLGGYLLVCDAFDSKVIQKLRQRKKRPHKPFAIMARNLECLKKVCFLNREEEQLLSSEIAPIVILDPKPENKLPLSDISPDSDSLGVMLPTTPLHHLLFGLSADFQHDYLIMTSGNLHGEPIARTNEEAFQRLSSLADIFVTHNRELARTCDDSLFRRNNNGFQVWRRARGLTPERFIIPKNFPQPSKTILALGADLKNSICLGNHSHYILSPYIGDLFHFETFQSFQKMLTEFPLFLNESPDILVVDQHPKYQSTQWGKQWAASKNIPLIEVQHHHAHGVASMIEPQLTEALCLVFDGTGYGTDKTLWGGELLYIKDFDFQWLGTFATSLLPGGEQAIKDPKRQAFARLFATQKQNASFLGISNKENELLSQMIKGKINTFSTRAVGRFFDSVAALLGLTPEKITYEGQAAIRLEHLAKQYNGSKILPSYVYQTQQQDKKLVIIHEDTFQEIWQEVLAGKEKAQIAWRFHKTLALMALDLVQHGYQETRVKQVTLSGGVFQNRLLSTLLFEILEENNFKVWMPQKIPINDGGIAIGQAVIAAHNCNEQE